MVPLTLYERGSRAREFPSCRRKSELGTRCLSVLLTAEAVVLAACSGWWAAEGARPEGWQQLALLGVMAFSMGLQSAATRSLGDPDAGTTYVTGT